MVLARFARFTKRLLISGTRLMTFPTAHVLAPAVLVVLRIPFLISRAFITRAAVSEILCVAA
jgi:hypothetical protein